MPVGGGAVWGGAVDSDPMAGAASHDGEFCAEASGRGHTFASERRASGGSLRHMGACKEITLDELRISLAGAGLVVANATLHRFFVRHGITRERHGRGPKSWSVRIVVIKVLAFPAEQRGENFSISAYITGSKQRSRIDLYI